MRRFIGLFVGGIGLVIGVLYLSYVGATTLLKVPYRPDLMASWVQAVGSIAAIIGSFGLANDQYKREMKAREDEGKELSFLLEAELAWLSGDVLNFANQFSGVGRVGDHVIFISDDDIADMLSRMTWCRQRVLHKGQLAMIGQMRSCVMEIARIVRMKKEHPLSRFTEEDVKKIRELRKDALRVFNCAAGKQVDRQFSP